MPQAKRVSQTTRRDQRRQELAQQAARVFSEKGLYRATMDDVAAACGVSKVVVYRHFGTKDELIEYILCAMSDRLLARSHPWQGYGSGMRSALAVAREDPASFLVLVEHAATEPSLRGWMDAFRNRVVQRVRYGLPKSDTMADVCAQAIATFIIDALRNQIVHGKPDDDERFLAWASRCVAAMRRGYRPVE